MASHFTCSLVTPERPVLESDATYADLPAHDGQFGVMTNRAAMLIELGLGKLRLTLADGTERRFLLDGGFAQMRENELTLLCERAFEAEEIDAATAQEAAAEAEAMPTATIEQVDARNHARAFARHMGELARG